MHPTAVILVVGLTERLLDGHAPHLQRLRQRGHVTPMVPVLPAVTCSVQSSMLTGVGPAAHGVVGNGWYNAEQSEVQFWKQSNRLVESPKIWEAARARDPQFTCAKMFWWYNMYATVDYAVTPRPIYCADGRKLPDVYAAPAALRDRLQAELGQFPLFQFWGPGAGIASSRWIAEATIRVHRWHHPTLTLVYLPHLDYALQKHGPAGRPVETAVTEVDAEVGRLADYFDAEGVRVVVVSEYGIEAVHRPIHINRVLRSAGLLAVRTELGHELLDAGASRAFAVADHQVAHVYVRDAGDVATVAALCREIDGVDGVWAGGERAACGLDHARAGTVVLEAAAGAWFTYYYWDDDRRAPDFAHCVEIHRKPGYDPCELFIDPRIRIPALRIARRVLQKKIGMRMLMDVIPLDATLVKGSHGRTRLPLPEGPLLITPHAVAAAGESLPCTAVHDIVLRHIFED